MKGKPTLASGQNASTAQEEKGNGANLTMNPLEAQAAKLNRGSDNFGHLLGDPDRPKKSALYKDLVDEEEVEMIADLRRDSIYGKMLSNCGQDAEERGKLTLLSDKSRGDKVDSGTGNFSSP